ncbi:uncharacterized protein LOC128718698 [Anopheles marshallii]|uniref:uncharacterized protein LOC128718698 n=1 Tax=Anopheles marshallii TaxID=1521116 RepID=UPI00237BC4B7|nr:uncharacterized protein LOC128718698 [Anopheles marshallii]
MEYKKFFKNTSMKRGEQLKVEVSRQHKIQRAKSRHAMRQTYRNMECDSEEENDVPNELFRQQQQLYQHVVVTNNKNLSEEERYLIRLQRLQQFHEQKRRKQEKQSVPSLASGDQNTAEKVMPLGERAIVVSDKTPSVNKKYVKPRVDCWRTEKIVSNRTENKPPCKPLSEKKVAPIKSVERPVIHKPVLKRTKETQQPAVVKQQVKLIRHALPRSQTTQPTGRPLSQKKPPFTFKLKPPSPSAADGSSKMVTSTVRKYRKPFTFSFEPSSESKQQKATLTVNKANDLFDGISPIEVESPQPKAKAKVNGVKHSSPMAREVGVPLKTEDSLWEPQPVACLSVIDATVHENVNPAVVDTAKAVPLGRDCSVSDWVPATVHQITSDTIVIDDDEDDDEVFVKTTHHIPTVPVQDDRTRKPALNESFTISVGTVPTNEVPMIVSSEPKTAELSPEQLNSEPPVTLKQQESNQSIERVRNSSPKDNQLNESMVRKRASLIFTEEPIDCVIVPSRTNLTLEEKQRSSVGDEKNSSISETSRRRSSVMSPKEPDDAAPPKDVEEKTRFYYEKVDGEVNRLQALCDQYAPFLETEQELNDHCRGLILAAQGQTNILIKKKLSKFRELIGHYEKKWNDRKVRHDDLDGFWVMLALDLDNLDRRFEELRLLKENNWQEVVPEEPQPKVKKLQGGGGVRKREKKPSNGKKGSSSVIADLIRKARQEKQKQKTTVEDLDALKETVTVVTTPVKRSVRFGESPQRVSLQKRSSLCTGCTPTTVHWDEGPKTDRSKRHTIFPDITQSKSERVKSILKPSAKANRTRRAKSVLFLDSGLDTPQARRRHSSRTIVDTPKPKIKFNDELEIEHIDNLAARTPSRLEVEIQKRRQQSLLDSVSVQLTANSDIDDDCEQQKKVRKPRGTPRPDSSALRRSNRRSARCFTADFDEESSNNNDSNAEEDETGTAKRLTRSSRNARKKIFD